MTSVAALRDRVEGILAHHGLDFTVDWTLGAEPFLTPAGVLVDALAASIEEVLGRRPALSTVGGTSDGRFLATICPQVVEFGPVNATIHQVDECVRVDDLVPLTAIYLRLLERLLAAPDSVATGHPTAAQRKTPS